MSAPHIEVILRIWLALVIGMMPGMIGTSMPIVAGALDELVVAAVVEEQLRDQERAPASTFSFV